MCGIVARWGNPNPNTVQTMMERMAHRGPDGSGLHSIGKSTVGHRRLSIIDPNGGKQPIFNESNDSLVIANGEIYNFSQLRSELAKRYTFRTDSEVILHGFNAVGTDIAKQLDGMFAFVLTDGEQLYATRLASSLFIMGTLMMIWYLPLNSRR